MAKKSQLSGWPDMLSPNLGGFAKPLSEQALQSSPMAQSLNNGMDFMKNLWGGVPKAMPGFVLPTMDLKEIDKRISDLKSVESWLELNANMLKATIQGLEVQRNTIAALQSFGAGNGDFMQAMAGAGASSAKAPAFGATRASDEKGVDEDTEDGEDHHEGWPMPAAMHAAQHARAERAAPKDAPAPVARAASAPVKAGGTPVNAATALGNASASAWMSFLQQQFAKVAEAAIKSGAPGTTVPPKPAAGKKVAKAAKPAKGATKAKRAVSKKVGQKKAAARRVLAPKA